VHAVRLPSPQPVRRVEQPPSVLYARCESGSRRSAHASNIEAMDHSFGGRRSSSKPARERSGADIGGHERAGIMALNWHKPRDAGDHAHAANAATRAHTRVCAGTPAAIRTRDLRLRRPWLRADTSGHERSGAAFRASDSVTSGQEGSAAGLNHGTKLAQGRWRYVCAFGVRLRIRSRDPSGRGA
jgi:hypothetical protein